MNRRWETIGTLQSKAYVCGYCGHPLSSEKGYWYRDLSTAANLAQIYICHFCDKPTFFDEAGKQTPGASYGNDVEGITDNSVANLYKEARDSMSTSSYTAAVLCCRKLLMHIAVAQGAEEGKNFFEYVKYLSDNHFVPPGAKGWVDHIRKKGNEANHEIKIMTDTDAKDLISFLEMLLKMIYEFPSKVKNDDSTPAEITKLE